MPGSLIWPQKNGTGSPNHPSGGRGAWYYAGVFTVRCTKKLLDRMRVDPEPDSPAHTTVLGDWYANLVRVGKQQLILCVSEMTLLPVVLPALEAKLLPRRLPEALFDVLKRMGIPWGAIDREMKEMHESTIGRTANRSVLGIVKEFAFAMPYHQENESLTGLALWLAETPCKPIWMESPDRATKAAFAESLH